MSAQDFDLTSGIINQTVPRSLADPPIAVIERVTAELQDNIEDKQRIHFLCDRAEAYCLIKEFALAEKDIEAVFLVDGNSFRGRFIQTVIQSKRDKSAALTACEELLRLAPNSAPVLSLRASIRLPAHGKISTAILNHVLNDTSQALVNDRTYYQAYLLRAAAYDLADDSTKALEAVDKYLECRPLGIPGAEGTPYLLKGRILLKQKNYEAAIYCFDLALHLDSESFSAAYGLWHCFSQLKDMSVAFKAAKEMYRISPEHPYTSMAMGTGLFWDGQYSKAIPFLTAWAKTTQSSSRVPMMLAKSFKENGQFDEASKSYDEAIYRSPEVTMNRLLRAHFRLSCSETRLIDHTVAEADLAAVRLQNRRLSVEEQMLVGIVEYRLGQEMAAIQTIQNALESRDATPKEVDTLSTMLRMMRNKNFPQAAIELAENEAFRSLNF